MTAVGGRQSVVLLGETHSVFDGLHVLEAHQVFRTVLEVLQALHAHLLYEAPVAQSIGVVPLDAYTRAVAVAKAASFMSLSDAGVSLPPLSAGMPRRTREMAAELIAALAHAESIPVTPIDVRPSVFPGTAAGLGVKHEYAALASSFSVAACPALAARIEGNIGSAYPELAESDSATRVVNSCIGVVDHALKTPALAWIDEYAVSVSSSFSSVAFSASVDSEAGAVSERVLSAFEDLIDASLDACERFAKASESSLRSSETSSETSSEISEAAKGRERTEQRVQGERALERVADALLQLQLVLPAALVDLHALRCLFTLAGIGQHAVIFAGCNHTRALSGMLQRAGYSVQWEKDVATTKEQQSGDASAGLEGGSRSAKRKRSRRLSSRRRLAVRKENDTSAPSASASIRIRRASRK